MAKEVKLTNVFHRTGEALLNALDGSGPRLIINSGGQGSSKTYSTLQVIYNALKGSDTPLKATLCSYALPHLKQGVLTDFDKILDSFGENIGEIRSTPAQPTYRIEKSEINCYGVEGNLAMAHGPRRDILFINECNRKISYEVFDQLFSRSGVTLVDFNPDREFWLHEKVLPNFPHVFIQSNYLDNPYLSESERQNIEMKKGKPGFENWWRVYGLGEMGKLEGAILSNWKYGAFDVTLPYGFGLDFGFNDPDTMIKVAVDEHNKRIYVDECFYISGNSAEMLRKTISNYVDNNELIIGDCADARMISELSRHFNIKPADKHKWTVAEGLKMMQGYEIIVTENSYNVAKELNNYQWSDSRAGVPMSGFDHTIDAIRYYFQTAHKVQKRRPQVWRA